LKLYEPDRTPAPIREAGCWAHWRRDFFDLAKDGKSPIAAEAVRRMDELFEIERTINGKSPAERVAARREHAKPLVAALDAWLREQRQRISAKDDLAIAINYGLSRWPAFTRFLEDGRVCLSNNAAERAVRGIAVGRRNWTFAGSDEGASYCSSHHVLISQRDFSADCQTPGVASAERRLRGERPRAPIRHGGLSMARPCRVGWPKALFRRSNDERSMC
jgi:transposase